MAEWIPVAERLPSHPDLVLVTYRTNPAHEHGGKRSVLFARYSGGEWRFLDKTRARRQQGVLAWMRVSPYGVEVAPAPSDGRRFYEALRKADPIEFPDEWDDLTPTWHGRMEDAARTYGVPTDVAPCTDNPKATCQQPDDCARYGCLAAPAHHGVEGRKNG